MDTKDMPTATMGWIYRQTESNPDLYTVGFYRPDGLWEPESDHAKLNDAAARVHWLNGGRRDGEDEPHAPGQVRYLEPGGKVAIRTELLSPAAVRAIVAATLLQGLLYTGGLPRLNPDVVERMSQENGLQVRRALAFADALLAGDPDAVPSIAAELRPDLDQSPVRVDGGDEGVR